MGLRLSRQIEFGPARTTPGGPGGRQGAGGGGGGRAGGAPAGGAAPQQQGPGPGGPGGPGGGAPGAGGGNPFGGNQRFSAEVFVQANNLLNRVNYVNFVGNLQSPFFGTATSAAQPRRIEVGTQLSLLRAPGLQATGSRPRQTSRH